MRFTQVVKEFALNYRNTTEDYSEECALNAFESIIVDGPLLLMSFGEGPKSRKSIVI